MGRRRVTRDVGFSIIEMMVTLLIIGILIGLTIMTIRGLRARAQRVQCTNNLRNLAVAANLYVQQYGSWPQIAPAAPGTPTQTFAESWVSVLAPFGAERKTWICPAIQNSLNNPDYSKPETARIDYMPMTFDDKPTTPHQWPRQPWFIETGDVHGSGNLIIFTDGSVSDVKTVLETAVPKQ
jgi:prepilin-type N-terminal cleavage/methylation domain-containing protein